MSYISVDNCSLAELLSSKLDIVYANCLLFSMAANVTDDLITGNETSLQFDMSNIVMMYKPMIDASRWVKILSYYVIIPIGLFGSVLTIIILRRSSMTSTGLYVYLMTIAIWECIGGIIGLIFVLMSEFIVNQTMFCRIDGFFGIFSTLVPDFLVAAVSVDKALVIVIPLKVKNVSTPLKAKMVVSVVILLTLGIAVQNLWVWVVDPSGFCVRDQRYATLMQITFIIVMTLMILTFLVALVCCCIITYHLHKHRQIMASVQSHTDRGGMRAAQSAKKDAQISAMLLSISLLYVITNFPIMIFYLSDIFYPWMNLSFYHLFLFSLLYEITILFINLNHSLNFYLYLISAKFFRDETKALFFGWLRKQQHNPDVLKAN